MTDRQDDRRESPDAAPAGAPGVPAEGVTGVASGSLGTAANLEETQVFRTADLQVAPMAPALPAAAEVPAAAAVLAVPAASPAPIPRAAVEGPRATAHTAAAVTPTPEPVAASAIRPAKTARPTRSGQDHPSRLRGLAGVLAAALVVLVGLAILTTARQGPTGLGGTPPQAGSTPTAQPATDAPKEDDDGKGNGKGNSKGNGKGNGND